MTSPIPDWLQVTEAVGNTVAGLGAVAAVLVSLRVLRHEAHARRADREERLAAEAVRREAPARLVSVAAGGAGWANYGAGFVVNRQVVVRNGGTEPIADVIVHCSLIGGTPPAGQDPALPLTQRLQRELMTAGDVFTTDTKWHWGETEPPRGIAVEAVAEFTDAYGNRWRRGMRGELDAVSLAQP